MDRQESETVQEFDATIEPMGPEGGWARIFVPFDVEQVFGTKSRLAVQGTLNGCHFRSSLFPEGDGRHYLYVNKGLRDAARVESGELVRVVIEPDIVPREIDVPQDLLAALARYPAAEARFEKMSHSQKKEYVEWIESAKKAETRAGRIEKSIPLILAGKRLKG